MSLLDDLNLAYEFLADDPIETSIHYGQSILDIWSTKVSTAANSIERKSQSVRYAFSQPSPRQVAARAPKRHAAPVSTGRTQAAEHVTGRIPQYTSRMQEPSDRSRFRTDFARPNLAVSSQTLVGAL